MNPQILTLFGEEYAPPPPKAAGKGRGKKTKKAEDSEAEEASEEKDFSEEKDAPGADIKQSKEEKPEDHPSPHAGKQAEEATTQADSVQPEPQIPDITITNQQSDTHQISDTPSLKNTKENTPIPITEKPKRKPTTQSDTPTKKPAKKRVLEKQSDILANWQPVKQYYTIGEVAKLFRVNTSHIRFWTNEFAFKVRTTKKGDRLYNPDQIQELAIIYHLVKERGFTLAGAKAKMKEEKKGIPEPLSLKQSLTKLRDQLVSIKDQLG